jgi:hypothetical protein
VADQVEDRACHDADAARQPHVDEHVDDDDLADFAAVADWHVREGVGRGSKSILEKKLVVVVQGSS